MNDLIWSTQYVMNNMSTIKKYFPELWKGVVAKSGIEAVEGVARPIHFSILLNCLPIGRDGYQNHDQLYRYLRDNKHLHTWWLL